MYKFYTLLKKTISFKEDWNDRFLCLLDSIFCPEKEERKSPKTYLTIKQTSLFGNLNLISRKSQPPIADTSKLQNSYLNSLYVSCCHLPLLHKLKFRISC